MAEGYTEFKDAPAASVDAAPEPNAVEREPSDPATQALVKKWLDRIAEAKRYWKVHAFDQMEKDEQIAAEGADDAWVKADKYVVPIINRHINLAVSQLYAKDPKAIVTRRRRLMYTLWDEKPDTLKDAMAKLQPPPTIIPNPDPNLPPVDGATGQPWAPDPQAVALIKEVSEVQEYNRMIDKLGKTVVLLWKYYTSEQGNGFKKQLKAMVRRTKVKKVSYIKLDFDRELELDPDVTLAIDDATSQLAQIKLLSEQMAAGEIDESEAKAAELRYLIEQLQAKQEIVAREGPVWGFPRSNKVIVDTEVTHFKTFTGACWIAEEMDLTPDMVKKVYDKDIAGKFKEFVPDDDTTAKTGARRTASAEKRKKSVARIYVVQDKENGQTFTVCEGCDEFLREPGEPDVRIPRFWTIWPLIFNELESDKQKLPHSDVYLARHPQKEMNRSREGLREHRVANRPKYAVAKGALSNEDKAKLASNIAHALLELKGLKPGQPVSELMQRLELVGIDPNMYDVSAMYQDIQRAIGSQEADLGGPSNASATQSSIAENSRGASLSENIDDLDELLTDVAHSFAQLCLLELSKQTVQEIVGPGAVWPEMPETREEVAKDLLLEIKAGSSGRPNAAAELANCERIFPFALQVPGAQNKALALLNRMLTLSDIDPEELEGEIMPTISVIAQNAIDSKPPVLGAPPGTPGAAPSGAPGQSPPPPGAPGQGIPGQQGGYGGDNAPKPPQGNDAPQAAMPAPAPPQGGPMTQA